jgi:hypothetical protein
VEEFIKGKDARGHFRSADIGVESEHEESEIDAGDNI